MKLVISPDQPIPSASEVPTREAVFADLLLRYARNFLSLDDKNIAVEALREAERAQARAIAGLATAKAD